MRKSTLFAILLMAGMMHIPGVAQEKEVPSLTVTGTATMSAAPDRAVVRLGVVRQASTAQEAQREASSTVQALLQALRSIVPDRKDIQTSQLGLFPVYSDARAEPMSRVEPKIVGYRASNIVSVIVEDLTKIGPIVDAAVKSGANQVDSIQFQLKDDDAVRERALTAAAAEARRKAQVIATALGIQILGIQGVSESNVSVRTFAGRAEVMTARADVSTPIEPGTISVEAALTIRYRISGK